MDKGVRNTLLGLAGFIALVLGLFGWSLVMPRGLTDLEAQELGFYRFDAPRSLPDFALTDHRGQAVGRASLTGRHSALFFGFTQCPHICPTTMRTLAESMAGLADPPQVILVSVDPERDTPARLAAYVPAFDPAFIGYTGSHGETVKLATSVNVAFGKVPGQAPGSYLIDHSTHLALIDPAGNFMGFVKGPHQAGNLKRIFAAL